jgi:hypothetical protein
MRLHYSLDIDLNETGWGWPPLPGSTMKNRFRSSTRLFLSLSSNANDPKCNPSPSPSSRLPPRITVRGRYTVHCTVHAHLRCGVWVDSSSMVVVLTGFVLTALPQNSRAKPLLTYLGN